MPRARYGSTEKSIMLDPINGTRKKCIGEQRKKKRRKNK